MSADTATNNSLPLSERLLSPILIKEMRSTMRGARFFIGITVFLLMIAGVSMMIYLVQSRDPWSNPATLGRTLFAVVTGMESMLLLAVAPSLTAGAIAGERQKQTFEMLMATPLTAGQVLRGKLAAALNYMLLLLVAGIPINSIVFLFGGITPSSLFAWMAWLIVVVIMLATFGLLISSTMQRAGLATTVAYLMSALLFIVIPGMVFFTGITAFSFGGDGPPCEPLALLGLLHPLGGYGVINGILASQLPSYLPYLAAILLLYVALSAIFYLISQARLSAILGIRNKRFWLIIVPVLVVIGATTFILMGPVQQICLPPPML